MKHFIASCLALLSLSTNPAVFAGDKDKYTIEIQPILIRAEWRGPSAESVGFYDQGFRKNGKAGKPNVISVDLDTAEGRKQAASSLRTLLKSRNNELKTARDNIAVQAQSWAASHTDHRENRYIHNHTTGTVNHNHNHNHTGTVAVQQQQQWEPCGDYGCECHGRPRRIVYRSGDRFRYRCPVNGWIYNTDPRWNNRYFSWYSWYRR